MKFGNKSRDLDEIRLKQLPTSLKWSKMALISGDHGETALEMIDDINLKLNLVAAPVILTSWRKLPETNQLLIGWVASRTRLFLIG